MPEEGLSAQRLEMQVLDPARAKRLVGQIECVLEDRPTRQQPGPSEYTAPKRASSTGQSIACANRTSACSMLKWSSRARNKSCARPSPRSRGVAIAAFRLTADKAIGSRRAGKSQNEIARK